MNLQLKRINHFPPRRRSIRPYAYSSCRYWKHAPSLVINCNLSPTPAYKVSPSLASPLAPDIHPLPAINPPSIQHHPQSITLRVSRVTCPRPPYATWAIEEIVLRPIRVEFSSERESMKDSTTHDWWVEGLRKIGRRRRRRGIRRRRATSPIEIAIKDTWVVGEMMQENKAVSVGQEPGTDRSLKMVQTLARIRAIESRDKDTLNMEVRS